MSEQVTVRPFANQGNWTQIANPLFDYVMPRVSAPEWKILCFILRKTIGWQIDEDQISISQIKRGTGIKSNTTVWNGCNKLASMGILLKRTNSREIDGKTEHLPTSYGINRGYEFKKDADSHRAIANQGVIQKMDNPKQGGYSKNEQGGYSKNEQGVVQKMNIQKKDSKDTYSKEKSLGASPSGDTPTLSFSDYDELPEISHHDVAGCPIFAKLKSDKEYQRYAVIKSCNKTIQVQTDLENGSANTLKYFNPEKIKAVHKNGRFWKVVLGEKEDKLEGGALVVFQDLQKLFGGMAVGAERAKLSVQFKEFAIVVNDKIGHFALRVWVNWYAHECKDQPGSMAQKFGYCQRTLEDAIKWAKHVGLYDELSKNYDGLDEQALSKLKDSCFTDS